MQERIIRSDSMYTLPSQPEVQTVSHGMLSYAQLMLETVTPPVILCSDIRVKSEPNLVCLSKNLSQKAHIGDKIRFVTKVRIWKKARYVTIKAYFLNSSLGKS